MQNAKLLAQWDNAAISVATENRILQLGNVDEIKSYIPIKAETWIHHVLVSTLNHGFLNILIVDLINNIRGLSWQLEWLSGLDFRVLMIYRY